VAFPGSFKIGTVSRRTGISSATLRVWEEQYGLLTPERTGGGQRLYTEGDVDRVLVVRELISKRGYSLQAIAGILDEARQNMPPLVQDLLKEEEPRPESRRLVQMAAELRAYLEDAHLRTATEVDQIRERELLTQIHNIARQVAHSATFAEASATLVTGAAILIGNQRTTLALYDRSSDVLRWVASARTGQTLPPCPEPWPLADLPAGMHRAFLAGQPYYEPKVGLDDLASASGRQVVAGGIHSFYGHPLEAGTEIVGLLVVTSRRVDGVSPEARGICARVATINGPAIAYFAAHG
jgi:DNA-binding transcriptional MerR regulator